MKYLIVSLVVLCISCTKQSPREISVSANSNASAASNAPDHIIFVWLENKGFSTIIGNRTAPYINSLVTQGTLFMNAYGTSRPSQPNYISFFAGTTNNVTNDDCLAGEWDMPNLYTELKKAGKTFAWYNEDLPAMGSKICDTLNYRRKHNPTTNFANVPKRANKPFSKFPVDYTKLENVVCITPNMMNDMHDGTIEQGDTWVQTNLSSLVEWCKTNNSIFVVYFDEASKKDKTNHMPVISVGQNVAANYQNYDVVDHYNWSKTICSLFGASNNWTTNLANKKDVLLLK